MKSSRERVDCSASESLSSRQSSKGFTLVELLVVVAIISILAALILPALSRGKAEVHKTSCINRLKQWNLAHSMYAQDNEDSIARESYLQDGTTVNLWNQINSSASRDVWYNALPEYLSERRAASYYAPTLRGGFYGRDKMFHCPSTSFPANPGSEDYAFFSYAMNSKLILDGYRTMKLGTIVNPSATVIFLDNRLPSEPKVDPTQPNDELGQPSAFATRFVTRHLGRGTLAFADGHMECLPGREVVTNGQAAFPQTRIIWTADPGVNPNL